MQDKNKHYAQKNRSIVQRKKTLCQSPKSLPSTKQINYDRNIDLPFLSKCKKHPYIRNKIILNMKLRLPIITFSALALCACGGNQNSNNEASNSDTTTAAVTTEEVSTLDETNPKVAMKVWDVILAYFDPYGMLEGDEEPSAEMIAENRKNIQERSNTVAEFVAEGAEGFSKTIACYKLNNGNWLVLDYFDGHDGMSRNLRVLDFLGGNLTEHSNLFPADFLQDTYLSDFDSEGFTANRDSGKIRFKWNGEKFEE